MLGTLQLQMNHLKMRLIKLGFALTPPASIHNQRLKQLQSDFKEIAERLGGVSNLTIYQHSQYVFLQCTGKWFLIRNLEDLLLASKETNLYFEHYIPA